MQTQFEFLSTSERNFSKIRQHQLFFPVRFILSLRNFTDGLIYHVRFLLEKSSWLLVSRRRQDVVKFPEIDHAHIYEPRDYLYRSISAKTSFFFFFPSTIHHVKVRFDSATMTSIQTSIALRSFPCKSEAIFFYRARTYVTRRDASTGEEEEEEVLRVRENRITSTMYALRSRQSEEVAWKISFRKKKKERKEESKGATSVREINGKLTQEVKQ